MVEVIAIMHIGVVEVVEVTDGLYRWLWYIYIYIAKKINIYIYIQVMSCRNECLLVAEI